MPKFKEIKLLTKKLDSHLQLKMTIKSTLEARNRFLVEKIPIMTKNWPPWSEIDNWSKN